ncbi:hypothetical protein RDWZM_001492 [Blomia tropicalis]|uniref:Cyclin-like domain-containing protein n=1 Tax=Blomia tropicalis TaxID=40697 RepID=A0A9Q0MEK9_BLOTA|nr:hypothetical protein RDWZM_001492 [Blomia tropicalis]
MSGSFWRSSHFQQWLLTKQDLTRERNHDMQILTEEEYQKLMIFFSSFIQSLGEQLKVKQQVIATAIVYFKRFYVRNSLKCIDPLLLAPTCLFLASKVEEFGVISNNRLISTCQQVECEFYLMEIMDCCLILYHPYRPLVQYVQEWSNKDSILPTAWNVVNDSFRTDVCLLYPPHQIALACLHIACVITQKDCKQWFAELNTDLDKILEITRYILNLFEMWKNFDEKKEIPALLSKMPKPKSQPSRPSSQGSNEQNSSQQNQQSNQKPNVQSQSQANPI